MGASVGCQWSFVFGRWAGALSKMLWVVGFLLGLASLHPWTLHPGRVRAAQSGTTALRLRERVMSGRSGQKRMYRVRKQVRKLWGGGGGVAQLVVGAGFALGFGEQVR